LSGKASFNYVDLLDTDTKFARAEIVETKGFFILPSQLFESVSKKAQHDVVCAKEKLNETLEKFFSAT
jgi:type I restriction enzyme M protein